MNETYKNLISLVPAADESDIDWGRIMQSDMAPWLLRMAETPQNPQWHGEGDVLTHTRMVCESLIKLPEWQELERRKQEEIFFAALRDGREPENDMPHPGERGERVAQEIEFLPFR